MINNTFEEIIKSATEEKEQLVTGFFTYYENRLLERVYEKSYRDMEGLEDDSGEAFYWGLNSLYGTESD